jgi:hypothetical protein
MLPIRGCAIRSALALVLLVSGCDMASQIKDGVAHSTAAAEAIEQQVGKKPEIGFNYNNGSFSQAPVQFWEVPATPLPELEKIARAAVRNEFKDEPASLVIAFRFPKAR